MPEEQQPQESAEAQAPDTESPTGDVAEGAELPPEDPQGPGEGGIALPDGMPAELAAMLMAQAEDEERRARMFIVDEKHANCPVVGCRVMDDGTVEIAYQVAPNRFASFRTNVGGQEAIATALQQAKELRVQQDGLVIADGPLPREMTGPGQMPGPGQSRRQ